MKILNLIFGILIVALCFSCDNNSIELEELEQVETEIYLSQANSITIAHPTIVNPDNPVALCIFCGCEKTYKKCKGGIYTGCETAGENLTWSPDNPEASGICCNMQRRNCHTCYSGFPICIKFGVFMNTPLDSLQLDYVSNNGDIIPLNILRPDQLNEINHLAPIISKWQNGILLNDEDYEALDGI